MVKKITQALVTGSLFLATASPAFAQQKIELCPKGSEFNVLCGLQYQNLGGYIGLILSLLIGIAVIIALFFLVYGGIKWILSGGDKGGVEAARNMIVAAVVGLAIVFISFLILNVVGGLFGINLLNFTLPSLKLTP